MLAEFCLRLAIGMVAFLPLLPADRMHPRFFRTQFLTSLGLSVVALVSAWLDSDWTVRAYLGLAVAFAMAAALAWTLEPPPLGAWWAPVSTAVFFGNAFFLARGQPFAAADVATSGLLLGGTLTAMLVGHSYLISPGLNIRPMMTMLAAIALTLLARVVFLGWEASEVPADSSLDVVLWLIPRWLIGIGGPALFGFLTWRTARIQSTQSATGILYVVVICAFLGELLGMLIHRTTAAAS
ncbi:MAG: hypothetical protein K1X57_02830 [Gemmataceae bacterium]|nr:hypothetical protein [Gemmataceae bacterium]